MVLLLLALLHRDRFEAFRLLTALGIKPADLTRELNRGLRPGQPGPPSKASVEIPYSGRAKRTLMAAMNIAPMATRRG